MNNKEYIEKYLNYLKSKGYSEETLKTRHQSLRKFSRFINSRNFTFQDIIEADIQQFSENIEKSLKQWTVVTHLAGLRAFYSWMLKNSYIMFDPAKELEPKPKIDFLPEIFLEDEMDRLFDFLPLTKAPALRNRAMLELSYSCLLRRNELVNIKLSDIDLKNQILRVDRKGGIEALLPFGKPAKEAVQWYLADERDKNSDSEYLWLNKTNGGRLLYPSLDGVLKSVSKQTGMEVTIHKLRRSGATHMLINGASMAIIQEMLSHSNLKAVKHYLRLCVKDYHETLKKSEWLR